MAETATTVEREGAARARAGRILAAIRGAFDWPGRVCRARRLMAIFAAMADHELRDIGLTRADLVEATALPLGADPSEALRRRAEERREASRSVERRREASHPLISAPPLAASPASSGEATAWRRQ